MNVLLFGASGMVGQGVLRECLRDDGVTRVTVVARKPLGLEHPKLRELIHRDFSDFSSVAGEFSSIDACFYCVGISSAGTSEDDYRRVTHDYTIAAARALPQSSSVTFCFVTAAGTDSTERGRSMWARVKGRTENELLAMPFRAWMFRPFYIQPMHGITSQTALYRWVYAATSWLYPVLQRAMPGYVTTTENIGLAMLAVARGRWTGDKILHSREINRAAALTLSSSPGRAAGA
jgi:uncharacterized protein YbjT (DUF2867 family)